MSRDKPIVYGVLASDRPILDVTRDANTEIQAQLVVKHGLDVQVVVNANGMLWLTIERQDQPGVPLRKFRYFLDTDQWNEV